jgi:hypothetical protein
MTLDRIPPALRRVLEQLTHEECKEVAKWLELAPQALSIINAVVMVRSISRRT